MRVFVSSTLGELAPEREAVRRAVERLRLVPVLFELGARPHPPRELYRAYLAQSHVFVGIYWERYGWVAPGESISGLEDEYRLAGNRPRLLYVKSPAPGREPRLEALVEAFKADDRASYRRFKTADELAALVEDDLALLLSERFEEEPLARDGAPDTAVPLPPSPTFGRSEVIDAVAALVRRGERAVTLTGPGGIGKTRIAVEVARAVAGKLAGGAHFVPLAAVQDPTLVLRTVADRTATRTEGTRGALAALADRFRGAPALLVLDNFEQVADAATDLARLLERCAEVQLLVTSRHALRIRAEREFPVPPLPLPDRDAPAAQLASHPAVSLFLDRARCANAPLLLSPGNADAVAELCRRLDGVPLAIEIAAAHSRVLPPASLLARLQRTLDLRGGSDLPERQRTLRSTLDWSHALLDERERALFAHLAVFAGGFALDAVEEVCATGDDPDVVGTLSSLLDKSLVIAAEDPGGEPRFQLLETIRAYAAEQLAARGETAALRERHLRFYRRFASRAQPFLCGPGQREWLARVDPERSNLRAAVETALANGDDASAAGIAWDVYVYYWVRDIVEDPEDWLEQVAARGEALDRVTRARVDTLRALTHASRGRYAGAREALAGALATFREEALPFEAAVALKELGFVRFVLDRDSAAAASALAEASRLFESLSHDWGVALVETMLGTVHAAAGDLHASERHLALALERAEAIANEPLRAQALQQLALVRIRSGSFDAALELLVAAAKIFSRGRFEGDATYCLEALGAVALARGRADLAAWTLRVARDVRGRLGITPWPTVREFVDGLSADAAARLGDGGPLPSGSVQRATAALEVALEALGRDRGGGARSAEEQDSQR